MVGWALVFHLRVYFRTTAFLAGSVELRRRECTALHGAISLVFFGTLILVLLKPFGMKARRASGALRLGPSTALADDSLQGSSAACLPRHLAIAPTRDRHYLWRNRW
jgi:hypothetical protein